MASRWIGEELVELHCPVPRKDGGRCRGQVTAGGTTCYAHANPERRQRWQRQAAWWRLVAEYKSGREAFTEN